MEYRMKILVIAPTPYFSDRGCHIRIYEETRALQKKGHEVRILTYHFGETPSGIETKRIWNIPFYKDPSPGFSWWRIICDIFLILKAFKEIRDFKPDIIHSHLHDGFLIAYISNLFKCSNIVSDIQGSLSQELTESGHLKNRFSRWLIKRIEKFIYRHSALIFVSSKRIQDEICNGFGISDKKILVIKDGVASHLWKERISGAKNKTCKNIIYTGALTPSEGIDLLIDSLEILSKKGKDFKCKIIGYPNVRYYERKVFEKGLSDKIAVTGRISYFKLGEALKEADIAVAPKISATEAHGKLVNYMACGLPVVCFDTPVNREILGDYGYYVKEKSPEAFAEKLSELLDKEVDVKEIDERISYIFKNFSWENICEEMIKGYLLLHK